MRPKALWGSVVLIGLLHVSSIQAAEAVRSYAWRGDLLATDANAKTLTVRVKVAEHVAKYVDRFKAGDRVVLVWDTVKRETKASDKAADPLKSEADVVMFIDSANPSNSLRLDSGYVLPAEFMSGDMTTATVKLHVDDKIFQAVRLLREGTPIQATASMHEPTDEAALVTIAAAERAAGAPVAN